MPICKKCGKKESDPHNFTDAGLCIWCAPAVASKFITNCELGVTEVSILRHESRVAIRQAKAIVASFGDCQHVQNPPDSLQASHLKAILMRLADCVERI